jgi:hypothetical protein
VRRYDRPANGVIARNIIAGGFGLYRMEGCAGVIMEDNVMRGAGLNTYGSWVSTYYAKATEGARVRHEIAAAVLGQGRVAGGHDPLPWPSYPVTSGSARPLLCTQLRLHDQWRRPRALFV